MKYYLLVFFYFIIGASSAQYSNLYNKNNEVVVLDTLHANYVILLKNNRFCFNCFEELAPLLDSIKRTKIADSIIAIVLTDSGIYSTYELSSLIKYFDKILFDYTTQRTAFIAQKPKENSVFSKFHLYSSPALLLIKPGKKKYLSTEVLYGYKSIDPELFSKITTFFLE